jgi:subtilisin family serine protease
MRKIINFTVQVIDEEHKGIPTALVVLKSDYDEFRLMSEDRRGFYTSEKKIPKGDYTVTVVKKPFEEDSRKITIRGGEQNELFILRKKGTSYYYRGKVKTPYTPYGELFALVIEEEQRPVKDKKKQGPVAQELSGKTREVIKKHNLEIEEHGENLLANGIVICRMAKSTTAAKRQEIARSLPKEIEAQVAPVLHLSENNASLLTNEILVKFDDYVEEKEIKEIARKNKLKIKRKISALGNLWHFTTSEPASYEVLDIANRLAELENVIFAEPNLIHTVEEDAITPTDFLFPEQWDHQIMNTPDAWQFLRNINVNRTFGNPDVIIAVVDSGVDPNHPDFTGNVSDGSSKIYQSFDFTGMVANNNTLTSDHGTCCASAAAARVNNASAVAGTNEGVSGVAGNCRVLAIRRGGTEARYADMYLWAAGFDPESGDANFPAQITPGADVITSSFGFSVNVPISGTMSAVFDTLTDEGRGGRGTLLFFSAGNANTDLDVTFARPWGMYARCFSVAASTLANDGVTEVKAGYSSFGSVVEFCAPSSSGGGVRSHNPTAGYGTMTATSRQAQPLQTLTIGNNANAGATQLTLSAVIAPGSGVLIIDNGNNTEAHFFTTIITAGANTNRCNLFIPLLSNQNNGLNVRIFPGFTPGNPQATRTLNGNANAGNNVITLNNAAGLNVGQAVLIENPGNANSEASIISAINGNQLTLGANLFNNHLNNAPVTIGNADYRNYFGGTSHSTPLCAGTAALMLSANPQLTWTQVRDIMRNTAVKINPGENNANGRWQDINGVFSNNPAYDGNPVFSEFYGFGRVDASTAVRQAGWDIELVTTLLDFNDVPTGETAARAVRFNVKSLWPANFNMTPPGGPFGTPMGTSKAIGASANAHQIREVYLWVTFTGTNPGDTITIGDGFSVTVTNPETEQEWTIPIRANTIEKQTAAIMLSLDRSGSMDAPSGIGISKRIEVLRFSANIMADVIQEGNGLGIVSFDHDAYDVLSFKGPLGPASIFEVDRTDIKTAINNFNANPGGMTSIGNGIERAQLRLNPVTGYNSKSIIVFTDGKENRPKLIEDIEDVVVDRVFAVGMGKAQNINPGALNAIANNTGGYVLLTDQLDNDSVFKLAKYFLQILAGVNNEDIVVDPGGTLYGGQEHRIPFVLNEADITSDIILMLPDPQSVDFHLETPNGHILTPSHNFTLPGLNYVFGNNVAYYRLTLPLPLDSGEREGKWHAILRINEKYAYGRPQLHAPVSHVASVSAETSGAEAEWSAVPYTLLVHAYSNLKMDTVLLQEHNEPGAKITLNVTLTQYGIPLETEASVTALLTWPNGGTSQLLFDKTSPGGYTAELTGTSYAGVYTFRIMASGTTLRGRAFTREQVRTGTLWQGGNRTVPGIRPGEPGGFGKEDICKLLTCIMGERFFTREFIERMRKQGINLEHIIECLQRYCLENKGPENERSNLSDIRQQYQKLIESYEKFVKDC